MQSWVVRVGQPLSVCGRRWGHRPANARWLAAVCARTAGPVSLDDKLSAGLAGGKKKKGRKAKGKKGHGSKKAPKKGKALFNAALSR